MKFDPAATPSILADQFLNSPLRRLQNNELTPAILKPALLQLNNYRPAHWQALLKNDGLEERQQLSFNVDAGFMINRSTANAAGNTTVSEGQSSSIQWPLIQRAAVLLIIRLIDQPMIVLTRRTSQLKWHAGQLCFPGGKIEATDVSWQSAALRETFEEIGLSLLLDDIVAHLPSYATVSGFVMSPGIAIVKHPLHYQAAPDEVAEVFEMPLQTVLDPRTHRLHRYTDDQGKSRRYFSVNAEGKFIWGATAALLRCLYLALCKAID